MDCRFVAYLTNACTSSPVVPSARKKDVDFEFVWIHIFPEIIIGTIQSTQRRGLVICATFYVEN